MDDNSRGSKRQRVLQTGAAGVPYGRGKVAKTKLTSVRIDPQVKDIPREAFKGCVGLAEVQFEEGTLRSIRDSAFYDCKALEQVTIPPSVTRLGNHAFRGCIKLVAVRLHEGALKVIGDGAFHDCKAVRSVAIPSSVTKLGSGSFDGCTSLASVQFEEGTLKVIGESAFRECTALKRVAIPSNVTELGNCAFYGCINLAELHLSPRRRTRRKGGGRLQVIGDSAFHSCGALQSVIIPPLVTRLGHQAFRNCKRLAEVQLGKGLQFIGDFAFYGCNALEQVTIPSSVTKLGSGAFRSCINLTEVQLNEGLQTIGESAFRKCRSLQQVTIPPGVTKLGDEAFSHCNMLAEVQLPLTVTKLGDGAFFKCIKLAEVQLHEGLQSIGRMAFYDCTTLRSVTMPSSATKLGIGAFTRCANLTEVILLGGDILLNQGFLDRGISSEEGVLNHQRLSEMFGNSMHSFAFFECPLTTIKISVPGTLTERMGRLPQECRLSVERRIRDLHHLELTEEGNVLACFPVVSRATDAEVVDVENVRAVDVQDTNNQTAESLHQVLRLVSFHEFKESSILIELAMWKSRLNEDRARADCRVSVPDPAKGLIMEYCGFTVFLEPAIEGT